MKWQDNLSCLYLEPEEAEIYSSKSGIEDLAPNAYDITNRVRGNRKSALKIKGKEELEQLIEIARRLVAGNKCE